MCPIPWKRDLENKAKVLSSSAGEAVCHKLRQASWESRASPVGLIGSVSPI